MILGRVVGELWATRRHEGLVGTKLLVVQPHLWYGPAFEVAHVIAIDTLGAGVGEDVLVCMGEPARQWLAEHQGADQQAAGSTPGYGAAAWLPVEAAVMAIVDRVAVDTTALPGQRPLRFIGPPPSWAAATATTDVSPRAETAQKASS